jgi:zinc transporter 1/2/3
MGIAIGMLLQRNMPSNHATVLIVQGILDGVASGILFYDSLVNIIVPHFNGNNFRHGKPWRQAIHFACLWLGATCMSLVGIWI